VESDGLDKAISLSSMGIIVSSAEAGKPEKRGRRMRDFRSKSETARREWMVWLYFPVMRVLAIDPAVRNTGYALLEGEARSPVVLGYDVISIPKSLPQSAALAAVRSHLANLIAKFQPDEVAVEGIIYVQSHQTAISMGAARAAALIAAADHGLPVYEYSPKKVKSAVVGKGNADKSQVAFMVRALLGLAETPPSDAADALAIGIAHLQASDPLKAKLLDRRLV
jgi:crossover junction endodeoxyribonuclease RuvC